MAEHGWPWDGREFGAGEIANAFECMMTNGVLDTDNDFLVSIVNTTTGLVRVGPGTAWIGGRMYKLDGYLDKELEAEAGTHEGTWYGGALVLRCDTDNQTFALACKLTWYGEEPAAAENEILLARYYRYRTGLWTEHEIKREVTGCQTKRIPALTDQTETTLTGLVKAEGGYLTTAVPGVDYMTTSGMSQGTFLPELMGDFEYTSQSGYYIRVKGIVVFYGALEISGKPTSGTGLVITGLPLAPLGDACCNIAQAVGFAYSYIAGTITASNSGGAIIPLRRGQTATSLSSSDMTGSTAKLVFSGCYIA